jgi:uncharacterized protein
VTSAYADAARGSAPDTRSVTVAGTASVQAVPNRAGFSAGVSSDAATAQAALAANATKALIVQALRSGGVDKADPQTQDVSVGPRWNEHGEQDGFTAHSSVQVHVQGVRAAGRLIDPSRCRSTCALQRRRRRLSSPAGRRSRRP